MGHCSGGQGPDPNAKPGCCGRLENIQGEDQVMKTSHQFHKLRSKKQRKVFRLLLSY